MEWKIILLVLLPLTIGAQSDEIEMLTPNGKCIKEGDAFELICKTKKPIEICSMIYNQNSFRVRESRTPKLYKFIGKGLKEGECGVRITNATKKLLGTEISCTVGFNDSDLMLTATTGIIFGNNVSDFLITTTPKFNESDEMNITCTAAGVQPAPNLTLYIDNKMIRHTTANSISEPRVATMELNGLELKCVLHQVCQAEPMETKKQLSVSYAPLTKTGHDQVIKSGNFVEGSSTGKITWKVLANPKPVFEWKKDGKALLDPNKYRDASLNMGEFWVASLELKNLAKADLSGYFTVSAKNLLGIKSVTFSLNKNDLMTTPRAMRGLITPKPDSIKAKSDDDAGGEGKKSFFSGSALTIASVVFICLGLVIATIFIIMRVRSSPRGNRSQLVDATSTNFQYIANQPDT